MSQPKPRRKKFNTKPSVISKKSNVKPTVVPSSTSIFGAKRGLKAFESKIVPGQFYLNSTIIKSKGKILFRLGNNNNNFLKPCIQ